MASTPAISGASHGLLRQHYRSKQGKCLLFSDIPGYALRISYDATAEFSTDWMLIKEYENWTENEGRVILAVDKKAIGKGYSESLCSRR